MVFETFVERTADLETAADLKHILTSTLAAEGYANHIMTSLTPGTVGDVAWFEFPDNYAETYLAEEWQAVDPILRKSLHATEPFHWNDVLTRERLSKKSQDFINACSDLRVHSGIVIPMFGPHQRCDLISISKRDSVDTDPSRVPILRAVCTHAWLTYLALSQNYPPASTVVLTAREREVALWIKDGKSNEQIAQIMNLTDRTVQFHISNIMNKLGASNRISAVVMALQQGLIRL